MKISGHEFIATPREGDVSWERRWKSDVAVSTRGNEKREAKRTKGLKSIGFTARPVSLEERSELEASIREGLVTGLACAPFWGRGVALAADCSASTVTLEDNEWGFAIGDAVVLIDQERRVINGGLFENWGEVRIISGVAGSVLTISGGAVARTYRAGALVWPLIFGKLECGNIEAAESFRANPKLRVVEMDPALTKVESSCPVVPTYLTRPLALMLEDFTGKVSRTLRYDLAQILEGFGAPDYAPLANNALAGWEFEALLDGATAIKSWNCFTNALVGRKGGFWIRESVQLFQISSVPGAGVVRAIDSGLAESFAADPCLHVIFMTADLSSGTGAKIDTVTDLGGGIEEITLTTAVVVDPAWRCYRLRYVRLASDIESGSLVVENRQRRRINVVELPEEYVTADGGSTPVWLYTFEMFPPSGGAVRWRFTSFESDVTVDGDVFTKANLNHGAIKRTVEAQAEEVELRGVYDVATNPLSKFWPFKLLQTLWVKIEETTYPALGTGSVLFYGQVMNVSPDGRELRAKCASALDALGAMIPRKMIGNRCDWRLYGEGCSRANTIPVLPALTAAIMQEAVTIDTVSADKRLVRVSGSLSGDSPRHPDTDVNSANYFALGWIESGAGATFQRISILKSEVVDATHQDLTLSWEIEAVASDAAVIVPGCDRTRQTCQRKFNNAENYGGDIYMPWENPSVSRPQTSTNAAKK